MSKIPKHKMAVIDYQNGMTYKGIAEKYNVALSTVKVWKVRHGWSRDMAKIKLEKYNEELDKKQSTVLETVEIDEELTDRQILFVSYYVRYWNATKAYQKAYPEASHTTALNYGPALVKKPHILREIKKMRNAVVEDNLLNFRAVLQKYMDIAFADITDYVEFGTEELENAKGKKYQKSFVRLKDSSQVDGTILTEVREGRDGVAVKLADKMKALEMLAKYTDLLDEQEMKTLREEQLAIQNRKLKAEAERLETGQDLVTKVVIVDDIGDEEKTNLGGEVE